VTTIDSFTAAPAVAAPGDIVTLSITVTTTAQDVLSGSATVTLRRDGVQVLTLPFVGFLDQQDISGGNFTEAIPLPPGDTSEPGNYEADILLDGLEDTAVPLMETATTSFSVQPTVPTVSPSALDLSAAPGETASGTFTITQGNGPFSLSSNNGTLSPSSANLGDVVTYSHPIAASVPAGTQLSDQITVVPASGQSAFVPVDITVTQPAAQPITVSPSALDLQGGAGETPTASFTITSGVAPFQLSSANAEGRGSFSNASPGLNETVDYGFRIPGGATDNQTFTDTITVLGADGEQATVIATTVASAGAGGLTEVEAALQAIANTVPEAETAAAIAIVCPSGTAEPRLQQDCNDLVSAALAGPGSALQAQASEALAQITTDQASSSVDSSQVRLRRQIRNVGSRISALRSGILGLSSQGLVLNVNGESVPLGNLADGFLRDLQGANGGAAGSDGIVDLGRLGVFINGSISSGDRDRSDRAAGYDIDAVSVTLGADYRFRDDLIAGAAIGYTSSETDLDNNGGDLDSDGYALSLYGTYYQESGLYLDGVLSYGSSDYDQRRNIRYTLGAIEVDQTAKASFDGWEWSVSVGGGYQMNHGPWTFGPTARIEYIDTEVDGFDERISNPTANGGGWATHIDDQDLASFTTQLGGQASYALSTSWGVLLPSVQLEWVHEFEDNAGDVVGFYLQDTSQTSFALPTEDLDRNYFNLTLGASAQFAGGRTGYISIRKLFGYDDLDVLSINAGLRLEF